MAGIVLYIFTLILESISVVVRFGIISGLVSLYAGWTTGIVVGTVAGLGPIIYSLLVVSGIPSGHILVRRRLKARPLSETEREHMDAALAHVHSSGVPFPQHIFAVDTEGLNAAISGRTMYVYRELFDSRYLPGVVAHELGHFNSMDGRLLLGIRALTVPGGFIIAYLLIGLLRWVAHGISTVLVAFLIVVFAFFRINLVGITRPILGITLQILRMGIIFAVGGIGPALLGSIWRSYLIDREFAADTYAGRMGYANDLIDFFETEVLSDVAIPWYEQPTHPTATRRIASLTEVATRFPQVRGSVKSDLSARQSPSPPPASARPQPSAAVRPLRGAPHRVRRTHPAWLLPVTAGILAIATLVAILLAVTPSPRPANIVIPTPGPTPTLGIPGAP
ncbi:MAG: M48 family metalloprotease [Chloroflexales bacterium]